MESEPRWRESPVNTLLAWNYGVRDLEYSFDIFSGEWLCLEGPVEGVLSPHETVTILLNYETAGLTVGAYVDTIIIESNDPWRPMLELPVSLSVYSHGIIRLPGTMPTLQAAIDVSVDGDTVLAAPGTYSGEGNRNIDFLGRAITEGSSGIDAGNPETPNIPWGGARRDMGAFEFDQGWYLDQNGNHIRKPEPLPISPVPNP